eukprot:409409-Hanusia_phi.AAC.1
MSLVSSSLFFEYGESKAPEALDMEAMACKERSELEEERRRGRRRDREGRRMPDVRYLSDEMVVQAWGSIQEFPHLRTLADHANQTGIVSSPALTLISRTSTHVSACTSTVRCLETIRATCTKIQ